MCKYSNPRCILNLVIIFFSFHHTALDQWLIINTAGEISKRTFRIVALSVNDLLFQESATITHIFHHLLNKKM